VEVTATMPVSCAIGARKLRRGRDRRPAYRWLVRGAIRLARARGVLLECCASSRCRLLGLLAVLEGPTDIDEPKHRDGWAIKHPCRPTTDANTEVPFCPNEPGISQFETETDV